MNTIEKLKIRRNRAYTAWYTGNMKRRTARRIIHRLTHRIEVLADGKIRQRQCGSAHQRTGGEKRYEQGG